MNGSQALMKALLEDVQGHVEVLTQPRSGAWVDPQRKQFDEHEARKVDVVRVRMMHNGLEIVGQEGSSKERGLTFRLRIPLEALSSLTAATALAVGRDRDMQIQARDMMQERWQESLSKQAK
jgi:hypothetical protein